MTKSKKATPAPTTKERKYNTPKARKERAEQLPEEPRAKSVKKGKELPEEAPPSTKKSTGPKKGKAEPKSKEKHPPREPAEKDAWGCRLGTRAAIINETLMSAKKPMTAKLIAELTDCNAVGNHLYAMIQRGHVEHVEDGYQIVKNKPKK